MKKLVLFCLVVLALWGTSCNKNDKNVFVYDVNEVGVNPPSLTKDKRKSTQQYISILYANLFQKALPANELIEIEKCIVSIGDKETAYEVVVSNFMNRPGLMLPTTQEMRANVDEFVIQTYKRFYVREPSIAEKVWWRNYLNANPQVTPELAYVAFALSEEYMYY